MDLSQALECLESEGAGSEPRRRRGDRRAVCGVADRGPYPPGDRADRRRFRAAPLARPALRAPVAETRRGKRRDLRRDRRLHHHARQCRRSRLADASVAAAARQAHLRGHVLDPVRGEQHHQGPGLWRARPADGGEPHDRGAPPAGCGDLQLCRHLAGAPDADRSVLPRRLRADVPDRGRADPQRAGRYVACIKRPGAGAPFRLWSALPAPSPALHDAHHRSPVLYGRDSGHRRARTGQRRVCGARHDLDPAHGTRGAALAGGRDPAADPAVPGRDLGLGLSP